VANIRAHRYYSGVKLTLKDEERKKVSFTVDTGGKLTVDVDGFGMNIWHVIHSCISNHTVITFSASTIPVNSLTMYHLSCGGSNHE